MTQETFATVKLRCEQLHYEHSLVGLRFDIAKARSLP